MEFENAESNADINVDLTDVALEEHASNDPGKMFVGGLSWQTTADTLRQYFTKFGEVNECMVVRDPATKRARGFGFITFIHPSSIDKVLEQAVHELDGKKIDPKVAFPKRAQAKMVTRTKKVFIGGLSATSSVDDMKNYFSQFGKIEEAMLMFDKSTNRHRGFGFICFDSENVVEKICEIHFHEINGKMVECKKAQPKEVMLPTQLEKSRALVNRSLYGIPEPLLASYAAAACLPRMGYNPGTIIYPDYGNYLAAPNYFGLMLAPGDKMYPDMTALSSPPALAMARPDWSRSLLAAGYPSSAAGFISSPTSPTGCPSLAAARAFGGGVPHGASPQSLEMFQGGAADLSSLLSAAAAAAANGHPHHIPHLQFKATQLIAAYNNYH